VYVISRIDQGSYSLDTRSLDPLLLGLKGATCCGRDKPIKFTTEKVLPVRIQLDPRQLFSYSAGVFVCLSTVRLTALLSGVELRGTNQTSRTDM
jgi:hypothetical protein